MGNCYGWETWCLMNCCISFISRLSMHIHNMKIISEMDNKFFGLKKKFNIHFIDCLRFYKSGYVYCSLYLFCFILQAVSTVLSTTSSRLFCLLLVQLVIHTYSIAKAQDSPCSLCRPGKPVNIKEHLNLVLEMWRFLGCEGNWILFLSSYSRTKVVLYQWLLTLSE